MRPPLVATQSACPSCFEGLSAGFLSAPSPVQASLRGPGQREARQGRLPPPRTPICRKVFPSPQPANWLFGNLGPASEPGVQTRPLLTRSHGVTAVSPAAHLTGLQRAGPSQPSTDEEEAETGERPPASNIPSTHLKKHSEQSPVQKIMIQLKSKGWRAVNTD